MPPPPSPPLADILLSTTTLLTHFSTTLSHPSTPQPSPSPPASTSTSASPSPLQTLTSSSALIKAHATKLGLLLLNKPFTPTAVIAVLTPITTTCLPALVAAVQHLPRARYGAVVAKDLRSRVAAVVAAVTELVRDVGCVAAAEEEGESGGGGGGGAKVEDGDGVEDTAKPHPLRLETKPDSTLASTAQTWAACGALAAVDPVDVVVAKAELYRALLRDAIDELKGWVEDEDEGFDGEVAIADADVQFGGGKCPVGDAVLREGVQVAVRRLRLCYVGMRACGKRRLEGFEFSAGGGDGRVERLDRVLEGFAQVSEEADELAARFYELDGEGAQRQLDRCCLVAVGAVEVVKDGWGESADEDKSFALWVDRWKALVLQKP